jgi:hypothetical protein
MDDHTITDDLSRFGFRELKIAAELLTILTKDDNRSLLGDGVKVMMNANSGYVFLSDEDFNTAMINGDKLELWLNCPECGAEGFAEDIAWNPEQGMCGECADDAGEEASEED